MSSVQSGKDEDVRDDEDGNKTVYKLYLCIAEY